MRIALVHNTSSGRHVAPESVREVIAAAGHEVVRVLAHADDHRTLADPPAELVVAAGGDGTVADAVRAIAGRGVPLTLLPLGTANNIAFSLGVGGSIEQLTRSWHHAPTVPFDMGVLSVVHPGPTPSGAGHRFVEGVGGGLIERCLTSFLRFPIGDEPPPWQLVRALSRYRQTLARLRTERWSLRLDGRPVTGEFLLVEVLNTRAVGPNFELAPAASPSDGMLTVVTAGEADRRALTAYIDDRLAGRHRALALAADPAQSVEIDECGPLHLDDEMVRFPAGATVSVRAEPGVVHMLVPPAVSSRAARP